MNEIDVGVFQHRLLAGPQSGVAGEHEPLDAAAKERGPHPRPLFPGLRFQ